MYMPKILKNKMERGKKLNMTSIIIYGLIFVIGTLFGSFFTLAVYRMPLGENIVYKHSFCPNCKEKLKFKDLIPILSFLGLRGKCAYCGEKIRIRYFLLEILSGIVFLLFALIFNAGVIITNTNMMIYFLLYILYIASLFIIAGIDKENISIQRSVLVFGLILSFCYMTYVYILTAGTIYTYIIYLVLMILILIADVLFLKKHMHYSYTIEILGLCLYMIIFSGTTIAYLTVILTLGLIAMQILVMEIKERAKKEVTIKVKEDLKIPVGFYLSVSNILLLLVCNFLFS